MKAHCLQNAFFKRFAALLFFATVFTTGPVLTVFSADETPQANLSPLNVAQVTLQNGTLLKGIINHNPHTGVVTVSHVNHEGKRVVDTINPAFIKNVEPAQPNPSITQALNNHGPLTPPLETVVFLRQGESVHGHMTHSSNPSVIAIQEEDKQEPTQIQWQQVVRISQIEQNGQQPIQPQPPAPPQPIQPFGQNPHPAPQGPASSAAPPVVKVTLAEGSTIQGLMLPNAGMGLITVFSTDENNHPAVDYIQSRFVQKVEPVEQAQTRQLTFSLTPPIHAKLWLITGDTVEGQFVPHQQVGVYLVKPEGEEQPVLYPAHYVPRLRLTMTHNAASAQPNQNVQEETQREAPGSETSLQSEPSVRSSTYYSLSLQPKPADQPAIPKLGTTVRLKTNIGQVFEGVVEGVQQNWITLKITKLSDFPVSPPRFSIINQNNIVSVETLES